MNFCLIYSSFIKFLCNECFRVIQLTLKWRKTTKTGTSRVQKVEAAAGVGADRLAVVLVTQPVALQPGGECLLCMRSFIYEWTTTFNADFFGSWHVWMYWKNWMNTCTYFILEYVWACGSSFAFVTYLQLWTELIFYFWLFLLGNFHYVGTSIFCHGI